MTRSAVCDRSVSFMNLFNPKAVLLRYNSSFMGEMQTGEHARERGSNHLFTLKRAPENQSSSVENLLLNRNSVAMKSSNFQDSKDENYCIEFKTK